MKKPLSPLIIPRAEHPVSRSMVSPNALKTLYRLKDKGYIAYLVGGCVRDLMLGREPKDFDVVTNATPGTIKKLFRNCRLVGRRFRLAHLHFRDEIIEVATFRSSASEEDLGESGLQEPGEPGNHRHPRRLVSDEGVLLRDNVFGSPEEDALRRDFTVNALAYDISDFSIIDYVGGVEDLRQGVIRTIGDPEARFTEDPVRMLRAVRFAALLGFKIEESTWLALTGNASTIIRSSAPRLFEEVIKLFLSGEGEQVYQIMRRCGLFAPLFPAFGAWLEKESEGFPHIRLGRDLEWIDRRTGSGGKVSQPLMFALMFGEFLEDRVALLREEGLNSHEAVNASIAALLQEQFPVVAIPHRVGLAVKNILTLQYRLRRIPGKRPLGVLARPDFADALDYLRCRSEVTGEDRKVLAWWERFARENATLPAEEHNILSETGRTRRRRRRRKPKAGGIKSDC